MVEKIAKYFPILLVICFVLDLVTMYLVKETGEFWNLITIINTVINTLAIGTLIFYVDLEKNNSLLSKIGLIGTGIVVIVLIIYYMMQKNVSYDNYSSLGVITKIELVLVNCIECLKYWCIINLISIKTNDSIAEMTKVGAIIANIMKYGLTIIISIGSLNSTGIAHNLILHADKLFQIFVITFVIYQLPYANDQLTPSSANQASVTTNIATPPKKDIPKFRNPALEEQEARLAAQQNMHQSSKQIVQSPIDSEPSNIIENTNSSPSGIPMTQSNTLQESSNKSLL